MRPRAIHCSANRCNELHADALKWSLRDSTHAQLHTPTLHIDLEDTHLDNLSDSYHLSVVRGSDSLTGAVLVRPHDYTMTLAPDPPAANAPSKLTWSPSGSSASSLVYVLEYSPTPGQTYADSGIHGDDGKRDFTASAFPESGTYQIQMGLATLQTLASSPGSAGEVILARVKNVTIP